jgi:orotate phosphoribosyltransferase
MTDIATRIEGSGAIKRGTFRLSDSTMTDYYIDKYVFETKPALLSAVTEALAEQVDPERIDLIAGPALGAVPLVTALSLRLGVDAVFVRKGEGLRGTQARIEGSVEKGMRAVVVEDVTMTGATAVESARVVEGGGAVVERVLSVVDRNEGAADAIAEAGYDFHPLVTMDEDIAVE